MATVTLVPPVNGTIAVAGTGYSANERLMLVLAMTSTDGRRKTVELYSGAADALGALTASVPVQHTSGTVIVKSISSAVVVYATSLSQAV